MSMLRFSENILKLRHQRHITQEELANFMCVTKASVSKWETGQSLPDVMLLPQLASFFDVTLDELLGYEPQLSQEQIKNQYFKFASDFAHLPFEEVMNKVENMVKKYYSCYEFLLQICILWINHFVLAPTSEKQKDVLDQSKKLCLHIIEHCQDAGICNDAIMIKALIDLQYQKTDEVIDALEDMMNPYRLRHCETILIQAYQMMGETDKAHQFTQWNMYSYLMEFIALSIQYLNLHMNDFQICEETIHRIDQMIEIYKLEQLNANVIAQFQYQSAMIYCIHKNQKETLKRLNSYGELAIYLLNENHGFLHGDDYFDELHIYFENSQLGVELVRDRKLILKSVIEGLENPLFDELKECIELKTLKRRLAKEGEK